MKVLQINVTANRGSTGRIAEGIGKLIINVQGISLIAYGRNANSSRSRLLKIGSRPFQFIHLLLSRLFDLHGCGSYLDTYFFIKKIKKEKPDIIHLHNIHGYYLNYSLLFKFLKKLNAKVVWTLHDCWAFTGHCSHFETVNCQKWKTGCFSCPLVNEYPKSFLDFSKRNYRNKKLLFSTMKEMTIVSPSKWLNKMVNSSFLMQYDLKVINNGINLNDFRIVNEPLEERDEIDSRFIILGVASIWTKQKGFYDFIELSKIIGDNFVIILIGLNSQQIDMLPNNIIGLQKTENVFELAKYYSNANVFFNPTHEDTFPTTNIEALACGTPVITYDTGGSAEIVDSKTGNVVEKGDLNSVLDLLNKMASDRNKPTLECRRRAEELYDENYCFQNYIELYRTILK